jgi:SAM-dependent methyltransferase
VTAAAARHFAQVAGAYGTLRQRWPLGAVRAREQRAVRELVRVDAGDRVLDVGCGDGATLAWLRARGTRAVGVDLVWAMACRARDCGAPVAVQDFEALGVAPVFDWALCIGALEFAADPLRALRELSRCVRPDGRLGLLFPRRTVLTRGYAAYHRRHGVGVRLFSTDEMAHLLAAAGWIPEFPWRDCLLSTVCVARRRADSAGGA